MNVNFNIINHLNDQEIINLMSPYPKNFGLHTLICRIKHFINTLFGERKWEWLNNRKLAEILIVKHNEFQNKDEAQPLVNRINVLAGELFKRLPNNNGLQQIISAKGSKSEVAPNNRKEQDHVEIPIDKIKETTKEEKKPGELKEENKNTEDESLSNEENRKSESDQEVIEERKNTEGGFTLNDTDRKSESDREVIEEKKNSEDESLSNEEKSESDREETEEKKNTENEFSSNEEKEEKLKSNQKEIDENLKKVFTLNGESEKDVIVLPNEESKKGESNQNEINEKVEITVEIPKENIQEEGSFFYKIEKKFTDVFYNSTNPEDIRWKVERYKALIFQLQDGLSKSIPVEDRSFWYNEAKLKTGTPLEQAMRNLIFSFEYLHIADKDISSEDNKRLKKTFSEFISNLRQAALIAEKDPSQEAKDFLYNFVYFFFTEVNIRKNCIEIVDCFAKTYKKENDVNDPKFKNPLMNELDRLLIAIEKAPQKQKIPLVVQWFSSLIGYLNVNFDPFIQSNPVHKLFDIQMAEQRTAVLAFGTPTNQNVQFSYFSYSIITNINEEFKAFLRVNKKQNKTHLYISNQNIKASEEEARAKALMNLQDDAEFKPIDGKKRPYIGVTLAKDSEFYWQKQVPNEMSKKEFISSFERTLFTGVKDSNGFSLPPHLHTNVQRGKILNLLNTTVDILFPEDLPLSIEQRKLLIEVFYTFFALYLIRSQKVDSFNITCKDAIDRGAGSITLLYFLLMILNDKMGDQKEEEMLKILLHARAIIVRKRNINEHRSDRCLEAMEFMMEHSEKIKEISKKIEDFKDCSPII